MPKINVKHIAKLANLNLTSDEESLYSKQFVQILDYISKLSEVNTKNIKPTYQVLDKTVNVLRKDEKKPSLTQKQALSNASRTHNGYFLTSNVFNRNFNNQPPKIKKRKQIDKYNAVLTKVDPKGTLGHKDLFCTKGIETTAGSNLLSGYIPQYSATVVNQLEKAGLKTKYKLNQDAWGHGSSGENSDFGPTKNPWDLSKVAGGSSSGSAAAVSTGDIELATGTDTCGSIRLPASFCNISSIKPTYGAVSRYGMIAFASSLDCPSLLAKSATKLKKYFNHLSKPDPKDCTSQSQSRDKGGLRKITTIGIPKQFFDKGIDNSVKELVLKSAELLEKNGYNLKEISLPHSQYGVSAYYIIAPTETSSNLARFDGIRYGNDRRFFGPEAKRRIMLGSFVSSAGYTDKYYEQAAKVRTLIIEDFQKAFTKVDAILGPVTPTPPFSIGEKTADPLQLYLMDIYAAPASLSGLPSIAIPCGFTNKLPVGMQIMGPRWSEPSLFNLAEKYQTLTSWHKKSPPTKT